MYRYLTIDEIVTQLSQTLLLKTRKAIANTPEQDLHTFYVTIGLGIISYYRLREENNPLTENWHKFPHNRHVVCDLDYSDDNPDNVAMMILVQLRKHLIQLGIK